MLEFDLPGKALGYAQVLDEIRDTGYVGTELGDWGFMPTDPPALRRELDARSLAMVGAFVPVAFADESAHAAGEAVAVKTARLLAGGRRQLVHSSFSLMTTASSRRGQKTPAASADAEGLSRRAMGNVRARRGAHRGGGPSTDRAALRFPSSLRGLRRDARRNCPRFDN